jgi:hypothetical protein
VRLPKLRWIILFGAILGSLVPSVALYRYYAYDYLYGRAVDLLWPSAVLLMVTDGHDHDPDVWVPITISVLLNMLLYAAIAALVWSVLWLIRRAAMRTP